MKKFYIFALVTGLLASALFAAQRYPIYTGATVQILSGTGVSTSDGTVTNTFSTVFSSAPKVIVQIRSATGAFSTNIVVSVTASNFVWSCGANNKTNEYIAIGTP